MPWGKWCLAFALIPIACGDSSKSDGSSGEAGESGVGASGASGVGGSGAGASGASGVGASGSGGAGASGVGASGAGGAGASGTGGRNTGGAGPGAGGADSGGESGDAGQAGSGGEAGAEGGSAGAGGAGNGGEAGEGGGPPLCVAGDVFDPDEVYLQGTLQEGLCGVDAIVHWSCPAIASTGFSCDGGPGVLRPNGRLVYPNWSSERTIHEFRCDLCPFQGDPEVDYPEQTEDNDPLISPPCQTNIVKFSPDGMVMYYCSGTWYELGGTATYSSIQYEVLHLGYDKHALTTGQVVNLATGAANDLSGLPFYTHHVAYRAKAPDKFWVASGADDSTDRVTRLYEVGTDGVATPVGAYPALPQGYSLFAEAALERSGALLQIGARDVGIEDVIVRRTLGGESTMVYDEADEPLVKVHISYLVTGP